MTDPLGQSQVLPYLTGLAKKNHEITLISFEKKKNYKKNYEIVKKNIDTTNINWLPLNYTSKPKIISTVIDIIKLKKIVYKLNKSKHFDIVHCRSYIAAIVGLYMKKKTKIKFIFDMRGFWADERIEGNIWNKNNYIYKIIYKYFKNKEKQFLQKADYVISLTNKGKEEILSWNIFKNKPINIDVIPCCCDTNLFNLSVLNPEKKYKIRNSLGIDNEKLVLAYLGSIGTWYMLPEMLYFFKRLLDKTNAIFLFITYENPELIYKEASKFNIPRTSIIITEATRNKTPELLAAADISIFFIKPVYSKKASSPTKQAEIMSIGQPIICNSGIGDTDAIIENYGCGIVIKEFSEAEFDKAISNINKLKSISPNKIRQVAIEIFDLQKGINKYDNIYKLLTN